MEEKSITVAIADDHNLFRKGIISLLEENPKVKVVYEAGNGAELLHLLNNPDTFPDVVLLDIEMPVMDGMEAQKKIKKLYPEMKVIILTMRDDEQFILYMISEGVNGYLLKDAEPEELEKAIEKVVVNDFYFPDSMAKLLVRNIGRKRPVNHELPEFTERELEVLELICREHTATEIAEKLSISPRTAEGHRSNLLEKSGSKNIAGLVVFALKNNLVFID